jgi:hypothetical protein
MRRCCLLVNGMRRHLGIRPVSQLNTWPVVSPVNASRRPSRDAAHQSGSGRMASPYPVGDFHLLFFASFPGALRCGSFATEMSCPRHVRFTPDSDRMADIAARLKGARIRLMQHSASRVSSVIYHQARQRNFPISSVVVDAFCGQTLAGLNYFHRLDDSIFY